MTNKSESVEAIAKAARDASRKLATLSTDIKNRALERMEREIERRSDEIIAANEIDMKAGANNGLSKADARPTPHRLRKGSLEWPKEYGRSQHCPIPVGEMNNVTIRPNGLKVGRMRVPIGVIGIIYESRPNVTADAAALCLKSGNAVILRGGSEAFNSNHAIAGVIAEACLAEGVPEAAVGFVSVTSRDAVLELLKQDKHIDLIIPRGGYELIRFVSENSVIPVIKHDAGVCHLYIDKAADFAMAEAIAINSKVQRPSACNALETLLVHEDIAKELLPGLIEKFKDAGVEIRGCKKTAAIAPDVCGRKRRGLGRRVSRTYPGGQGCGEF